MATAIDPATSSLVDARRLAAVPSLRFPVGARAGHRRLLPAASVLVATLLSIALLAPAAATVPLAASVVGVAAASWLAGRASAEGAARLVEIASAAAEEERIRIARDLHDVLGHNLTLLAVKAELACRLLDRDVGRAAGELEDVREAVRACLDEVRETVTGYRAARLAGELSGARIALAAAGIDLAAPTIDGRLDPAVDGLFAWVVREGVTNVVRHSGATRAAISIDRFGRFLRLRIVDDGAGSASAGSASAGSARCRARNGLRGIRERAEQLGGGMAARRLVGGGFLLEVRVPAPPADEPPSLAA